MKECGHVLVERFVVMFQPRTLDVNNLWQNIFERKARERLEFENDLYFSDQVYNWFVGHFPAVYLWTAYAGKTRSHQNLILKFYKDKEERMIP